MEPLPPILHRGDTAPVSAGPRWYVPTPGKFVALLLLSVAVLSLSDQYDWFAFNKREGWTVLIAVTGVVVGFVLLALWAVGSYLLGRRSEFGFGTLLLMIATAALPCVWLTQSRQQMFGAIEQRSGKAKASYKPFAPAVPLRVPSDLDSSRKTLPRPGPRVESPKRIYPPREPGGPIDLSKYEESIAPPHSSNGTEKSLPET